MTASYNGWPLSPARSPRIVPGTNTKLEVVNGPAGDLLIYVAEQFHKRVEPITATADDWGYSYRKNVNNPSVWSCHASATAIDLNATRHPNGRRGTFTTAQVKEIRAILRECSGVVGWGGDFGGTADEMHFEISGTASEVAKAAAKLGKPVVVTTPAKPTIQRGSTGEDVKLVQRFLAVVPTTDPGYGTYGPRTEQYVREYQRSQGLTADGVVGPKTWARILSVLS